MPKVLKNGAWVEGKASPQQLRQDLRELPGELITTDVDDPNKIHELDPDHVRDTYFEDYVKKAQGEDPGAIPKYKPQHLAERYGMPEVGSVVRFTEQAKERTQAQIDIFRLRIASVLLGNLESRIANGKVSDNEKTRWHIWFPKNNINNYSLKEGNPPPDSNRPKHLRGYKLHIDLNDPVPPGVAQDLAQHNPELLETVQ